MSVPIKEGSLLGHTHYIVWSTSSDKGVLYVVGGKKIKIKIWILILVGGKNKKKVGKLLFLLKINKFYTVFSLIEAPGPKTKVRGLLFFQEMH